MAAIACESVLDSAPALLSARVPAAHEPSRRDLAENPEEMMLRLRKSAEVLATSVLLVVLSQLPFWLMQSRIALQRPFLNLDFFVAVALMFWRRPVGIAALLLAWLVEINHDASVSYHFVGAMDLIEAARYMNLVHLDQILSWKLLIVVVAMGLCLVAVGKLVQRQSARVVVILAIAIVAFGLDALNGSNHVLGIDKDRLVFRTNIAGSPSLATIRDLRHAIEVATEPMERMAHPLTYDRAVAWHASHPKASVLLVLVESMGEPKSAAARAWLKSRLETPEIVRRWSVDSSADEFHGSTVYGELRLLCGLQGHYSRLTSAEEAGCLPHQFISSGGAAFGLHGFTMRMFNRETWWRDMGITPQTFDADEATRTGGFHCNDAFPGVCDPVVLHAAARLADVQGRLVYVVTLDTHLPLPATLAPIRHDLALICASEKIPADACQMLNRLGGVLDSLAREMAGMTTPVLVLVSGDHAPPFIEAATRNAFESMHTQGFSLVPR